MSYKELRNFTELMKGLGYERLISMENFRVPNFPLVAEILIWMVRRFNPAYPIPTEYDTRDNRVMLIRECCQFLHGETDIALNPKHLYQADGYAVHELLKAASFLHETIQRKTGQTEPDSEESSRTVAPLDISSKVDMLRRVRQLAVEIVQNGGRTYDLLGKEVEFREMRANGANRQVDTDVVTSSLLESIAFLKEDVANTKQLMESVTASEASLDSKIEKKQQELERNRKRLDTLKKVRPAHLDEYERLEEEFRQLYDAYMVRFRSVAYLEQQQDEAEQAEQERMQERQAATQKLLEQMKREDRFHLDADDLFDGSELKTEADTPANNNNHNHHDRVTSGKASRVRIKTASQMMRKASASTSHQRQVFGTMTGPDDDDSGSLDSDSDILLDADNSSDLLGTEDEDELSVAERKPGHSSHSKQHSDDDF